MRRNGSLLWGLFMLLQVLFVGMPAAAEAAVVVSSPAEGQVLEQYENYNIVWSGAPQNSAVYLMKDGAIIGSIPGTATQTGSTMTLAWKPDFSFPVGSGYQIMVKQRDNQAISGLSGHFKISQNTPQAVKLVSPVTYVLAGEAGNIIPIKWTYNKLPAQYNVVELRLFSYTRQGPGELIARLSPNGQIQQSGPPSGNGSYDWRVPADLPPGKYTLRLKAMDRTLSNDRASDTIISDAYIRINNPRGSSRADYLVITSPTFGGSWIAGNQLNVSWQYNPAALGGTVDILFMQTDSRGVSSFQTIASRVPIGTNGRGSITLPAPYVGSGLLQVKHSTNTHIWDDIPIKPSTRMENPFKITSPAPKSLLIPGSTQTVSWQPREGISVSGPVQISLARKNDSQNRNFYTSEPIPTNQNGGGSLQWQVPTGYEGEVRLKVSYRGIESSIDCYMGKMPTISLEGPKAGENLPPGSGLTLSWNYTSFSPNMKVSLFLKQKNAPAVNGRAQLNPLRKGDPVVAVIAANLTQPDKSGTGAYKWSIPKNIPIGDNYYVEASLGGISGVAPVIAKSNYFSIGDSLEK